MCDVTSISSTFQAAFHGNDAPFKMHSELKVSESTGDFRRPYEYDQLSLLFFIK
jgi:hypothetical protein